MMSDGLDKQILCQLPAKVPFKDGLQRTEFTFQPVSFSERQVGGFLFHSLQPIQNVWRAESSLKLFNNIKLIMNYIDTRQVF